jgi:magnesium-protoporphyrin O-methyltransferase
VRIDASSAYIEAAQEEARRQGHQGRVSYQFGNFVDLAKDLNSADIVTLDRVICCYHDAVSLVGMSGKLANSYYGIVYPRDTWWVKLGWKLTSTLLGLVMRISHNPFLSYIHASREVTSILTDMGFQVRFHSTRGPWQIVVFARQKPTTQP